MRGVVGFVFGTGVPGEGVDAELAFGGVGVGAGGGEDASGVGEEEKVVAAGADVGDFLSVAKVRLDGAVGDLGFARTAGNPGGFLGLGAVELVGPGDGEGVNGVVARESDDFVGAQLDLLDVLSFEGGVGDEGFVGVAGAPLEDVTIAIDRN